MASLLSSEVMNRYNWTGTKEKMAISTSRVFLLMQSKFNTVMKCTFVFALINIINNIFIFISSRVLV